jgi:hypothetical protein
MSMYRSRNQQKRWQRKRPWKYFISPRVDERFCPECRMPYHEGPLPKEVAQFNSDSVTVFIFPAGGWRKGEYVIRLGRWKAGRKQLFASEFIPDQEIPQLLEVVELARKEISMLQGKPGANRKKVARR